MKTYLKMALLAALAFALPPQSLASGPASGAWVAEVSGMSCPLCAHNIEKQLKRDPNVSRVTVDLGKGEVTVVYALAPLAAETSIRKAIDRAGFTVGKVHPR